MLKPGRVLFLSLLAAITLLSVLFRAGPLDSHQRPDETYVANNLLNFYRGAGPEPSHFIHPPLYHYFCWAALAPVLRGAGDGPAYEAYAKLYFNDRVAIYKVCRLVAWFFSAALPPLVFLLAWRLYGSLPAALLAGSLLSLSVWQSAHSRDALPDAPMSFFFTAAAGLALIGAREKRRGLVMAAAFLGGLAAAIKTNGAAILPAVCAALWFIPEPAVRRSSRGLLTATLCVAAVCAAGAAGLYLTGAWETIVYNFSPDGRLEPDSLAFCRATMAKIFYLSIGTLALSALLLRRLWRPPSPGAKFSNWEDRALLYIGGSGPYIATLVFAVGFFIFNPYWLIYFKKFLSTLILASIHVQSNGHLGMMGNDWTWYFSSLWQSEGLLALVLGLGVALAMRARGAAMAASVFFLLLFLYIGSWEEKADRFMQVFLPLGCLAAAGSLYDLTKGKRWLGYGLSALIVVAGVSNGLKVRAAVLAEKLPDSRALARSWMESSLPAGSAILLDRYFLPELHSAGELEAIRSEFSARGLTSVEEAYRRSRLFKICEMEAASALPWRQWQWATFEYLVVSSDGYWHLFDPAQEPPPGHILREVYLQRLEFYGMVLGGKTDWLKPLARFGGKGMSGPVVDIYKIGAPGPVRS